MAFKIVIEPRAIVEAQTAINYYEGKQTGLGEKFKTTLNNYIKSLAENPYYQTRYKDYRALPLTKFPYILFFYINENKNTVYIIALFHSAQNPEKYPD